MNIKPIGDRVVILPDKPKSESEGGILIPEKARDIPLKGTIIAVGEGRRYGKKLIPLEVKVGDRVMYGKFAGTEIESDEEKFLIMPEGDVIAII